APMKIRGQFFPLMSGKILPGPALSRFFSIDYYRLVMMMLMFFHEMLELLLAHRLFRRMDLRLRPCKDLLGLDAVGRILHEFPVLHHPLHIVGYPGLFFRPGLHA